MASVTISLDDELAHRARIEAAKQGKSLSRYLAELLRDARQSSGRPAWSARKR